VNFTCCNPFSLSPEPHDRKGGGGRGEGYTPYNGREGRLLLKGVPFSRGRYKEGLGFHYLKF